MDMKGFNMYTHTQFVLVFCKEKSFCLLQISVSFYKFPTLAWGILGLKPANLQVAKLEKYGIRETK